MYTQEEIDSAVVPFSTLKSGLHKLRGKPLPKLPTSICDIVIPTENKVILGVPTSEQEMDRKFLFHKSANNGMLIFSSLEGLEILSKSKSWHAGWNIPYGSQVLLSAVLGTWLVYVSNDSDLGDSKSDYDDLLVLPRPVSNWFVGVSPVNYRKDKISHFPFKVE